MIPDESDLEALAGAIASGDSIDWDTAESKSADASARKVIRELRIIAGIAEVHGSLPLSSGSQIQEDAVGGDGGVAALWGHLRVLERIGQGAFGHVYRAWDTRLDREVALKLLPARSDGADPHATSIIEEGRLLARVRHPNIVTIYGAERIGDRVGLWMELVAGQTLEQILKQRTVFSAADTIKIGIELCRAVSAVHDAGLLHRDIKTHNVMLADDGRPVLMDFGTGRDLTDRSSDGLAGTPLCLAPEVLAGEAATIRSDVYSLGVLLYHLLTASYPVKAGNVTDLRMAHQGHERTRLATARPDVSPRLIRVIEKATESEAGHRYQDAASLAADLASLARQKPVAPLVYTLILAAAVVLVAWQMREGRWSTVWGASGASSNASVNPIERPVIAVLPLKNLSAEPDSGFFVDGLTDEIIRNLAAIDGLEVRSRTSSFAFKDKPRNVREVGRQLGAHLVVEGSVLRSGDRLRVNAQLIQVAGDVPLWSDRFDRELKDVFAIQDEISRAIVNRLQLTLGKGQHRANTDVEVYELYLKGRELNERRSAGPALEAVGFFEEAIARDPGFAPAYAGLANAYAFGSVQTYQGMNAATALSRMRAAAQKAIQLDPLLSEGHMAMGWVHSREFDWANAERAFRRAIELNPTDTQAYTSYSLSTLQPLGKHDEALRLLQVARQNDPLSLDVMREIGEVQLFAGHYREAIETLERVRLLDPELPFVDMYLARALLFGGRLDEAISIFEEMDRKGRPVPQYVARAYVVSGRRTEAERLAEANRGFPHREMFIHAALGDLDRAFEAVERARLQEPQRIALTLSSPEMAGLRNDPRFTPIRKLLRLP